MIKAILMDFNGVIIDDELIQMRAYQEVLSAEGIDLNEDDYMASLGMDDRTFVAAAYERAGKTVDEAKTAELTSAKLAMWREVVADDLPLFEGVEDFIAKMAREFTLGIVSMSGSNEIEYVLEKGGLRHYFASIVSADDVSNCKPDPEIFRTGFRLVDSSRSAAGHLPITHSECLVIEDSPPGVLGARRADLPVLGVANTVSDDELRKAGAGAVAKDLKDWMPETIRLVFDQI
jgi:beta-phosphoglucomutase